MKPKNLSRLLITVGVALIIYSQVMDVSIGSFDGEPIVNLHLLSRQQNYLWLGGISLLAGILLFSMHRMKQSKEDERQEKESEEAAVREAVAKASAGASKSVAAFGSAVDSAITVSSDVVRQAANFELASRIVVGVFVGLTFCVMSYVFSDVIGYPGWLSLVILLAVFLYSLKAGSAPRVKAQLLAANAVMLSVVLICGGWLMVKRGATEDSSVLFPIAAGLVVSLIWLYRLWKRA